MSEFNELCFQYIDEKQYKKLNKIYGKNKEKYEKIIIDAYKKIDIELQKTKITYSIQSRIKSLHSIYKKINDRQMTPETIYDFLALRVICENKDACYSVLGNVHKLFKLKEDKFKDYISMPKENGYQAIHTTVYDKDGNMLEFQILTKDMYRLNQT
jgi:GTP pyrophosphokinase